MLSTRSATMQNDKSTWVGTVCSQFIPPPPKKKQLIPAQWVKRQGREADHSPPASAEVKKMWIYTSTPPYTFTA
jgi:hypothetical protein